jgi:hypothetical protein
MIDLGAAPMRRWLSLPGGVRVEVEPLTTARAEAARTEAIVRAAGLQREAKAQTDTGMPPDPVGFTPANASALAGMAEAFEIEALARFCVVAWEGLGVAGEPAPINPATLEAFARHAVLGPAFRRALRAPLEADIAEGNASALSSDGAGAGAPNTATAAATGREDQTAN